MRRRRGCAFRLSSPAILPLTDKQRRVLRSVVELTDQHGVAPSVVELSQALGLKHPTASYGYVGALEQKGYVRRIHGRARSIVVLRDEDGGAIEGLDETA